MSSLILPSAVAALTHKRLAQIESILRRKVEATRFSAGDNPPVTQRVIVNDVERRILALAEAARDGHRGGTPIDQRHGHAIVPGVSREALAGATAWEWPHYAQSVNRPTAWMTDAMRRGSPDPAYGQVVVPTTDFAMRLGLRLRSTAVGAEEGRALAFSLGLFSGIAAGVVLSPIQRGLHDSLTRRPWTRHDPSPALGVAERLVLRDLVGGSNPGDRWLSWLPETGEIPDPWFADYLAIAEEIYGFGEIDDAALAPFIEGFEKGEPLSGEDLRAGYDLARLDASLATWSAGGWYLTLLPALLAPPLGLLVGRFLPNSSRYFTAGDPGERGRFELLMSGMEFGALAPIIWTSMLWSQLGVLSNLFVEVMVANGLQLTATTLGLISAGTDWDATVRWGALFGVAQAADLYKLVRGIMSLIGSQRLHAFAFLLNLYPSLSGWLTVLIGEIFNAANVEDDGVFVGLLIGVTALFLLVPGLLLAFSLQGGGPLGWVLDDTARFSLGSNLENRSTGVANTVARVFDESTLWRDPDATGDPGLDQFRYPAQRRALVRIWWEGAGQLEVAHDAQTVRFRVDEGPETPVVLGPVDVSSDALLARLTGVIGAADELKIEVVHDDFAATLLPHPATLLDPGDEEVTLEEHSAKSTEFRPVGTTADDAYLLLQGPHGELTTGFGMRGVSSSDLSGYTLAPVTGTADLAFSGVGLAAELSAILTMGAIPTLGPSRPQVAAVDGRPALANPVLETVNQVFRRWNLNERRANEWRMIVAGGARSEKGDPIESDDPAMRPVDPAYGVHAPEGEPIANAMGWIPAFQAWLRVAADLVADTDATTSERYTPEVPLPNGNAASPNTETRRATNRELSSAVRFLFDLR